MAKKTILDKIQKLIEENNAQAYIPAHYTIKVTKVADFQVYDNEYGEGHYEIIPGQPKLEGTRGEHWSPSWGMIVKKFEMSPSGEQIDPERIPKDEWVEIQTPIDRKKRSKNITWVIDPLLVSKDIFKVFGNKVDPGLDLLCMGGDEKNPSLEWGCWPKKRTIFADTYEPYS